MLSPERHPDAAPTGLGNRRHHPTPRADAAGLHDIARSAAYRRHERGHLSVMDLGVDARRKGPRPHVVVTVTAMDSRFEIGDLWERRAGMHVVVMVTASVGHPLLDGFR